MHQRNHTILVGCVLAMGASLANGRALAQTPSEADQPDEGAHSVPRGASGAVIRRQPTEPAPPPEQRVVVQPELVHFVPAKYPPEALQEGLKAEVLLTLTIAKDGTVTQAEVAEGAGHGFDEAAQKAALGFKFTPATVDGVPTTVKISYLYRFTFEEKPAPKAEEPTAPAMGQLEGVVNIAGSDIPIAGAQVTVQSQAGSVFTAESDDAGRWVVAGLPPGAYEVAVTVPGYHTATATEEVVSGEATAVTYRVAPQSDALEITVQGERPPREVTRRTLSNRELARVPGTGGDALRALQSLPGIARPPFGMAGMIIVRGSAPEDSAAMLQGMHIPLAYHFGGLSSVVPTELIERLDYYPGNFSARYGRVMGGIIDIEMREPNTTCNNPYGVESERKGCYHGLAQIDMIDGRLMLEGPITKKWSFAVAGRRSWFDTWFVPFARNADLNVSAAPVYYDFQAIAETRPTADSRLRLVGFGSTDRFRMVIPAASAGVGNLDILEQTYRGQVVYNNQLTRDLRLDMMVAGGVVRERFGFGPMKFNIEYWPIETNTELGWQLGKSATINLGLDLAVAPYNAVVTAPPPPLPGEPEDGSYGIRPLLHTDIDGVEWMPAGYLEAELTPTPRMRVVPGIRFDYAKQPDAMDASPRINARYDIVSPTLDSREGHRARRTTIKGGVGLFSQPADFQETDDVFGTPGLESNHAIHYSVGVEQELTRQIEFNLEGFYKDLNSLVSRNPDADGAYAYDNQGSGYVVGLESMLKYNPDDKFFGWIAYTLSRSVLKDNPDAEERLFEYDQTHNLTALGSYRLGKGWELGARFRLVSGPLDTPVKRLPALRAVYNADGALYVPLEGKPYSERLPTLHQLDVRVDKVWQFRDWKLNVYLDVQNVYNYMAPEYMDHSFDYTQSDYGTGLPILPSLGVRGEF